ncbi:MAG: TIGR00730 family Rossman fold protein [Blastocatellia bacterium]|nr:TIGR00730 family Rossman fold protein [Blastocatellia bacterium]MBL8193447.1 TIGR00730 family Rossman fold protein [Blastocatellia bacterium]MBN8723550.1 TIGR00730 family Rossman fold protein [Acidobacteriota bacterium]
MKRICVFCGSTFGAKQEYKKAAQELGQLMAKKNIGLVYGGGNVGLMGEIANAVLKADGNVIGVIPNFMVEKELAHRQLTELKVVNSMHERKALMAELSDGFIALSGGIGTFEELFEILTWRQLGIHNKPCGILNVANYYDKLIDFINYSVEEEFVKSETRDLIFVESESTKLLERFLNYPTKDQETLDLSKT